MNDLKELSSAEEHCSRVYNKALEHTANNKMKNKMQNSSDARESNNNVSGQNNCSSNDNENNSNTNASNATNKIIDYEDEKTTNDMLEIYLTLFRVMIDTITKRSSIHPTQKIPVTKIASKEKSNEIDMRENDVKDTNLNFNLNLNDVLNLAEKCHDRFDALSFLSLLPKNIPLCKTEKYLRMVLEFQNHKKRNLMVSFISILRELKSL